MRNEVNRDLHPAVRLKSPRGGVKCGRAQCTEISLELTLNLKIKILLTPSNQMEIQSNMQVAAHPPSEV